MRVDLKAFWASLSVFVFFLSDSPLDDISDSETEELAEMRIDDWLVFQLDREVREHCGQHCPFNLLNSNGIFPMITSVSCTILVVPNCSGS